MQVESKIPCNKTNSKQCDNKEQTHLKIAIAVCSTEPHIKAWKVHLLQIVSEMLTLKSTQLNSTVCARSYQQCKTDVSSWVTQLTVFVLTPSTDHQHLHLIHIISSSFRACANFYCTVSDRKILVCFNLVQTVNTAVRLMNNSSIKFNPCSTSNGTNRASSRFLHSPFYIIYISYYNTISRVKF